MITAGRTLPWLQDTNTVNVWGAWGASQDDVRIVDSANRLQKVFNLASYPLSDPSNYATLRQLLLQAAQESDTDTNGLPDDWEVDYFGTNGVSPTADPDGDGFDNLVEFAFGSDPARPSSIPAPLQATPATEGQQEVLSFIFRRRAGSILDYVIESSADLNQWTTNAVASVSLRTLYDGTGTAEETCVVTNPAAGGTVEFYRVRAARRAGAP